MNKTFLTITLCFFVIFCFGQSGKLDPSFGNRGIVSTDLDSSFNYSSAAKQVLVQPNGSIYIVLDYSFISKRLPDGAIDSSYGLNGYSRSLGLTETFAALQPDGKIVVTGSKAYGICFVERLTTNGFPDSSFGVNGVQSTPIFAHAVAVQPDGKIIVGGFTTDVYNSSFFGVMRYNPNGAIDSTFNGGAPALIDFVYKQPGGEFGEDSTEVHNAIGSSVAIQPDGKIILGGYVWTGNEHDFALARYTSNGQADSSFGLYGKQTTSFSAGSEDLGTSVALQANGQVVLAGFTSGGGGSYFAVARYNTNGSLDHSFNGTGLQTASVLSDGQLNNSVAIQKDGKIVLAGYAFKDNANDFALVRFNANGSADAGFGSNGVVETDVDSSDDYAGSVAIQADDRIVAAGFGYFENSPDFALTRYNANGSLDSSFDHDGKLKGQYKQGYTKFNATVVQQDGKVVNAGLTWNGTDYDFAVVRYNVNGSPDNSFNGNGKQVTNFGSTEEATSIVLQNDGKIVVAGNSGSQVAIARYNADGSNDNTFNGNGKLIVSIGFADVCQATVVQSDGKILIGGYTFTDSNYDSAFFALVRINSNGTFDNTFNGTGKQLTNFESAASFASSMGIQKNGKIVVAGRAVINGQNNFALARYNANGSLDNTFSGDGKQTDVFSGDDYYAQSLAIQNDGKIVLGGTVETPDGSGTSFAIARYQANGTVDDAFGTNGCTTTYLGPSFNIGRSVAVNNEGRIALAGTNDDYSIVLYKSNGKPDSTFGRNGIQVNPVGEFGSSIQQIAFWNDKLYAGGYAQFPGNFGTVARYIMVAEDEPLVSTFITAANGKWNEPATWIGGIVPYPTSEVIVRHNVSVTTNTTCYSLKIEGTAGYLTVMAGSNLTITH